MLEGRTRGQALEIDGKVLTNDGTAKPGEIVRVKIEQNFNYDLLDNSLNYSFVLCHPKERNVTKYSGKYLRKSFNLFSFNLISNK